MKLEKQVLGRMVEHAKRDAPIEACGYLAAKDGVVTDLYALHNVDKTSDHFSFAPAEQFTAVRDARTKGLEICAVYHSHPVSPARPSKEDIALAFDERMTYVIVSLAQGKEDTKAFRIRAGNVTPEDLEIIDADRI